MKDPIDEEIKKFITKPLSDSKFIRVTVPKYPRISIVTPSFNQSVFLERTILSVLNQNYPNLEYIIIDGGSTDGSVDIIKRYSEYLSYWVSEKDKGQAEAINKGFKLATGDILAWLNSDDLYLPDCLLKVGSGFVRNRTIGFIYGHSLLIDKDDNSIRYLYSIPQTYHSYIYDGGNVFQGAVFWRKEIFCKHGMLDESLEFAMEYKLFDSFFKYERGAFVNDVLAAFRIHAAAKSSTIAHIGSTELARIRGKRFGILSGIYYKCRWVFYYIIYGNLVKTLRERAKSPSEQLYRTS